MGINIFYIFSIIYGIIASLGFFAKKLPTQFLPIWLGIIAVYYLFYATRRKIEFFHTIIGAIIVNLSIQLTGSSDSPLFLVYFLIIPIIGYKDTYNNYWIITVCLLVAQAVSGVVKNSIQILPLGGLALIIVILGIIIKRRRAYEIALKKSLIKYETREQFFRPANFEAHAIQTAVRDIDRHHGEERPLLYFVKLVHNMFNAYTTAIFSYYNNNLVLVQGFSRSELFCPDTVVSPKSAIYCQVISEQKPVLIKEFCQNPEILEYYKGEVKISSAIIAPIMLLDQIEGLFVIDRKDEQFSEEDKKTFEEAANTAGYFLAMLRLYEKKKYEAQYLSSISEIAKILQKGLDLKTILTNAITKFKADMKCDDISIAAIDELTNSGIVLESTHIKENTKFSLDDGLVGIVGKHRNFILKDDLSEGNLVVLKKGERKKVGSFVGIPVQQDDELLGVLWLEDHRKKRFNEDDVQALNILSFQLSLAWQRANLYERVKELSIRDGLTGLYNHRHFQELLGQEIDKQNELILLFFDIDHFKKINDTYGHQAGDEVLNFLGRLVSQTGYAARYGGEEFAIILPGCTIKKGAEIAVRLKDHLKKSEIKFNQIRIKITISIGIAHYPRDAKTRIELIEKADKALYVAKETGRDRIVIAQTIGQEGRQKIEKSG